MAFAAGRELRGGRSTTENRRPAGLRYEVGLRHRAGCSAGWRCRGRHPVLRVPPAPSNGRQPFHACAAERTRLAILQAKLSRPQECPASVCFCSESPPPKLDRKSMPAHAGQCEPAGPPSSLESIASCSTSNRKAASASSRKERFPQPQHERQGYCGPNQRRAATPQDGPRARLPGP